MGNTAGYRGASAAPHSVAPVWRPAPWRRAGGAHPKPRMPAKRTHPAMRVEQVAAETHLRSRRLATATHRHTVLRQAGRMGAVERPASRTYSLIAFKNASPHRSSLAAPTPDTCRNSSCVRGFNRHMSWSVWLENTM